MNPVIGEARNADIFVLIIGGRYGSEVKSSQVNLGHSFFDRYDSITRTEYANATESDVPTYILIDSNVYSEYQTFLKNRELKDITYAHVDSINIFLLIDSVLQQPHNNPIHTFDRFGDIADWLMEQWAGLFRELLNNSSNNKQLASLTTQVSNLSEVSNTLRTYLEEVISKVSPEASAQLINDERLRLDDARVFAEFSKVPFISFLNKKYDIPIQIIRDALVAADDFGSFAKELYARYADAKETGLLPGWSFNEQAKISLNDGRLVLGLKKFRMDTDQVKTTTSRARIVKAKEIETKREE